MLSTNLKNTSTVLSVAKEQRKTALGNMLQSAINRQKGLGVSLYKNWAKSTATATDTPNTQKSGTDIILG